MCMPNEEVSYLKLAETPVKISEKALEQEFANHLASWFEKWVEADLASRIDLFFGELKYRIERRKESAKSNPKYFTVFNTLLKDVIEKCGYKEHSSDDPYNTMPPKSYLASCNAKFFIPGIVTRNNSGEFLSIHIFTEYNDKSIRKEKVAHWSLDSRIYGKGQLWVLGDGDNVTVHGEKFLEHMTVINEHPGLHGAVCSYFTMNDGLPKFFNKLVEGLI